MCIRRAGCQRHRHRLRRRRRHHLVSFGYTVCWLPHGFIVLFLAWDYEDVFAKIDNISVPYACVCFTHRRFLLSCANTERASAICVDSSCKHGLPAVAAAAVYSITHSYKAQMRANCMGMCV